MLVPRFLTEFVTYFPIVKNKYQKKIMKSHGHNYKHHILMISLFLNEVYNYIYYIIVPQFIVT